MTAILITGANGFIGSNLCRHFSRRGRRIYAFVRETADLRFLRGLDLELIRGDLSDPSRIGIPGDVSAVIHSAALVSDLAPDDACASNIYQATVNLVRRIQEVRPALSRFIYMSTALVLGFEGTGISEERPGRRTADFIPYARHKKRTEDFLLAEHRERNLPLVILRPGDVYGPNDRTTCFHLLKTSEQGFPLIAGHGRWRFPYCYVGNLCQAVELVLDREGIEGRAYSVTNRELPTWREFFEGLQKGLGRKQRLYVPVWLAFSLAGILSGISKLVPGNKPTVNYYRIKRITTETTLDISRTIAELGYQPDENIEAQIAEIVAWYLRERKNGALA